MSVKPVPDGYHTVTPYLIVGDAKRALEFYRRAFGAVELMRLDGPDGRIGHAEIKVGDSPVMLADEFPEMDARSPHACGGTPVRFVVYVDDVDGQFERATTSGAKVLRPVQDQFYGDRSGTVEDPFGHVWTIATRKEDLPVEEIARRAAGAHPGSTGS